MEHQKMLDLLVKESNSKFLTRNWNIVNDQLNANYDVRNDILSITQNYENEIFLALLTF